MMKRFVAFAFGALLGWSIANDFYRVKDLKEVIELQQEVIRLQDLRIDQLKK